jgi:hypothetical protein
VWGYREIVVADFEFETGAGERPVPLCLVAQEILSGRIFRIFEGEFGPAPPYATGPDVLFVAFFASAELSCYRALGWAMPERILDCYVEFRDRANGLRTPAGWGLLGALTYFGLDGIGATEKKEIQEAIGSGNWRGRYTREQILNYCASDITATRRLLQAMAPGIDLPRALVRGRYMAAVSLMEFNGVPIDTGTLERLRHGWTGIQDRLIAAIDADYGIFDGRTFKEDRFAAYLKRHAIPWPLHESGRLDLGDKTFREMSKGHPCIAPLRELRSALSELRLNDLKVGKDQRNRVLLSPFRSRTGRNQPSSSQFIFGNSVWLRGLIKPPPGYGLGYCDWSQQEFGIAAALSGDVNMQAAYASGDPYVEFGKLAGLIPPDGDGTSDSHKAARELCKQCVLGVQYVMGPESLAQRIGQPTIVGRDLLHRHRETFPTFWNWSDAAVDQAMLQGEIWTTFGWHLHIGADVNSRSLRNFPMQSNASEMLRIAACLATERGIEIAAPIHDAFLVCAPLEQLEADIAAMRAAMTEASKIVLGGFELRTDCPDRFDGAGRRNAFPHVIRYPDRFMDKRGARMWAEVLRLLDVEDGMARTA